MTAANQKRSFVPNASTLAQPFYGTEPYQQLARRTLPLLVRQAQTGQIIRYGDLAQELEMPSARNLDYVLGSVAATMRDLSTRTGQMVPPIQCVVVNKKTGMPGNGVPMPNIENYSSYSRSQKEEIVRTALREVFHYNHWNWVLREVGLTPTERAAGKLLRQAAEYKGGGETAAHRKLKLWIASHPEVLGLPLSAKHGVVEMAIPSGDTVDVVFTRPNEYVAVEVKSRISPIGDVTRGVFQCVKYQAVFEAMLRAEGKPVNVRTFLVLEEKLPGELIGLKNALGIQVLEALGDIMRKSTNE